jgi:hypothetical protein
MKMGSIAYGEGVETQAIKSGAPLGKTPDAVSEPSDRLRKEQAQAPVTELLAPTQRPNEAITSGIDMGPGAGSAALMMKKSVLKTSDTLAKLLPFDTDGSIAILYSEAVARGD